MEEDYYQYTKKFFSKIAPFYDVVTTFVLGLRKKVVDFTKARSGSKILDVATGTGDQAFAFARKGYDVIGIDLSEEMLKVAEKKNKSPTKVGDKYKNLKFKLADAANMPFEDRYFDVSCVSFALHDMPLSIRLKVLKEMVRVTKPKGIIVIVDYALPKNKIISYLIYHFVKSYDTKYYPGFIKSDIRALLGKSGVRIEKERSVLFGAGRIIKGINGGKELEKQ